MGANSKIEWTHHTFNPWIGCTKVSPGCAHCYAEALAKRTGLAVWGDGGTRHVTSDDYWKQPLKWAKACRKTLKKERVFCASLADVFDDRPDLAGPRHRLWELILDTKDALDWMLLTKRPVNFDIIPLSLADALWLGVSVENRAAKGRIEHLRLIPAAVRFLSIEPLIEDLGEIDLTGINLVIVGGESGTGARPCNVAWIHSIIRQCKAAGVACFVKQLGARPMGRNTDGFEGDTFTSWPIDTSHRGEGGYFQGAVIHVQLHDRKGGDMDEWPHELRVREMPEVSR